MVVYKTVFRDICKSPLLYAGTVSNANIKKTQQRIANIAWQLPVAGRYIYITMLDN